MSEWTLFSNHGHVLVCLAKNNEARLRDVSAEVGITERAVQNILRELQDAGLVSVSKHGRCNHYQINSRKHLRHALESHCTVGKLLQLLLQGDADHDSVAVVAKSVEKSPKPAPLKTTPVEPKTSTPAATSPSAHKVTNVEPTEIARDEVVAAKAKPDPVKAEQPSTGLSSTEQITTAEVTTDRAPSAVEAVIETAESTEPEAELKKVDETPVVAAPATKPEPARSKKAADKKDEPKKGDKVPSSQQGSLF